MLTVTFHRLGLTPQIVEASSLKEASRAVTAWQSRHGYGNSDLGMSHGVVHLDKDAIAKVSYNGRVWPNVNFQMITEVCRHA